MVDEWQTESQGLAGAGLRETENIMPRQGQRDRFILDRGWLCETRALQCGIELWREAKHIKI